MKLNMTFILLFLYSVTLCPSTAFSSQRTDNISTKQTKVPENFTEKNAVVSDTFAVEKAMVEIRNFYGAYTADLLSDNSSPDSLMKKYLTKRLIEKVGRMRTATGADPIVRAQDFTESSRNTLDIKYLDENWYLVGYRYSSRGSQDTVHTNIPLRVTKTDGRYMIDYITPVWNGSLYGDSLLFDHPVPQAIDASAPLLLLKTFYAAYTMEYCSMPEDLMPRLEALRKKYLTPNALSQFEAAANESKQDGQVGYDLLIDYFDFDRLWLPSVKFTQLEDEDTYQMCYTRGETPCAIELKVIEQGKEYRIDSIIKEL